MATESAKAFYERLVTDETFRIQYQSATTNEERREVILAAGYNFTPKEWEAATTQIQASSSADSELNDAQLAAVSGGGIFGEEVEREAAHIDYEAMQHEDPERFKEGVPLPPPLIF